MSLQVTQANPTQAISGVTSAQPNQTISGVTSANPGNISGVQSSPTGNNYNPQGSPSLGIQPAATTSTVMPNTQSAGQATQPAATSGSGAFSFMDGSGFNAQGNYNPAPTPSNNGSANSTPGMDANGNPLKSGEDMNITASPIDTVTPSTSMGQGPSNSDVMSAFQDNLDKQNQLISQLQQLGTVPQSEKDLQAQNAADAAQVTALGFQEQGLYNPGNQTIALPFLTGQAQNQMVSAQLKQTVDAAMLNYAQGNREFAFNSLKTVYDASRQNLLDTLQVYTQTAPQNITTTYNPLTGDITGTFRNPITGKESSGIVGNAGKQKNYTDSYMTSIAGIPYFVGVKQDGTIDKIPVVDTNGNATGTNSSLPTFQSSGDSTPTATSTPNGLLTNWTGNSNNNVTSPYGQAVAQTYQTLTGNKLTNGTSTQELIQNIPALANGIAVAEGWNNPNSSQHALNNPGNIIWDGQPNATPQVVQTSSGPRTFAKFNTEQDGWNAEYNLLAKKLGATQSSSATNGTIVSQNPNIQNAITKISNFAAPYGQAIAGAVQKTSFGHYFVDTTQLSSDASTVAQNFVPTLSNSLIKAYGPDITQNIKSINTTMSSLGNMESLIQGLPSDPMDPQRAINYIKANFGSDPTLARLQESWQAILPDLQAQIGSQGISRLATGFLSNPQLSIVPSVTSIRGVAQAMIDQTKQLMGNRENVIFGGPPPPDINGYIQNLTSPAQQANDAYLNFANQFLGSTPPSSLLTAK